MKIEQVTRKEVTYVELQKDKKQSLGISIRDGTHDEAAPVVKSVKQGGPAAKSLAIGKGDVILSVNGQSTAGATSKDLRRMLNDAGLSVYLQLLFEIHETRIVGLDAFHKKQVTLKLKKVNGSFGFLLRKKASRYSFSMQYPVVSNIKEGSTVHRGGQLQEGDHLLMIDGISLSWLSLAYIAALLEEKEEAEFTFEYIVGWVNLPDQSTKLDLEIDVPVADVGISFRTCHEECMVMLVDSIRQGSVAARCGVFSDGDVILSINGIDAKDLTVSKSHALLRNAKRSREISFIKTRQKVETQISIENSSCLADRNTESVQTADSDWKHLNTPASSNFACSVQQKYNFQSFCYSEQFKSIDKIHSMISVLSSLKQILSTLTCEAFRGTQSMFSRNCTFCNKTQHTVKLCTSCLARINVKCAQSMDVLRSLVAHFVSFSTNVSTGKENQLFSSSVSNLICLLTEILPNIFRVSELQECFIALAEKVASSDTSCSTCDFEVKSVMIIVQQLLLVLSVRDNSEGFTDLIEHLVCCLIETKFTCSNSSVCMRSAAEVQSTSSSDNLSESVYIRIEDQSSFRSSSAEVLNNSETESNGAHDSVEDNLNISHLQTSVNYDFLKLTHIQNDSEPMNSDSESTPCEVNAQNVNQSSFFQENNHASSTSISSEEVAETRVKKFIKYLKFPNIWKSLESLIRPRRSLQNNRQIQNASHPSSSRSKASTSNKGKLSDQFDTSVRHMQNHLLKNDEAYQNGQNVPDSSKESSPSSSRYIPENTNSRGTGQVRQETMKVTLRNHGSGFGLDVSRDSTSAKPVISRIQPKSPSHKIGVIKSGDRILAINDKSTSRLSSKQLLHLQKKAFTADTVSLTVEFDVVEEDFKFGTFDVVLDRTLKTGLFYEDMKQGSPMVVSGIAKGSAAHRCGQLFPRDKLTFFRFERVEEFDPVSTNYIRDDKIIITVQRESPIQDEDSVNPEESASQSPCYVNPCFHHEDSVPRTGRNFVVKSTAIRSLENEGALALEHEVTLMRDPVNCDFGILLGEDPDTGRAYVSDIRPDGPAHQCGVMKKMDRIVKVNGVVVDRNVYNSVLDLLSKANQKVDLLIRRIYREELNEI